MTKKISLKIFKLIFFFFLTGASLFARELSLKDFIHLAIKNNLDLKASQEEVKAAKLEYEAAKGARFPRLKLEEYFYRSDIPSQVFMFKLNQEDFKASDFEIKKLNNPSARNNFETRLTIELPIWLGGKIGAEIKAAEFHLKAIEDLYQRKEEEIILEVYKAYLFALLSKESIKVAESSIAEAKEALKIAKARYEAGTALLSDVKRAEVYLATAEESLVRAKNYYSVAKKRLEVITNTSLGDFEVAELRDLPEVNLEKIKKVALENRRDLKALEKEIQAKKNSYRAVLSENLPQISAFASYGLNDKDKPFGSEGNGYLLGLGLTWKFDLGLTTLRKAESELKRAASLEEKYRYLKDLINLQIEKAYADYLNAKYKLKSTEARISASEEVVKIMKARYQNGLVRMLDLLDAQTQLDQARFGRIEALKEIYEAYAELLFASGLIKEEL
ncbi:MAG: TolC family protein [Caldimicrobium thiodismutans]